ncbi:hypothetical protein DCAR_0101016 [Daucus carota subsp. sativus]|uniref:Uncharacterized protein n=1 Tax=Daucus carota subsp. sativus TaxID=79200 RepID=A0A175YBE0_DAUCS|nr:hypothetical protein DCAR_0101016 [Daucus carota subsp. sativus]
MDCLKDETVIIIIAGVKVSEWKEVVYLSNFPATRFYLNLNHPATNDMKLRRLQPDFYSIEIDDEIEVHDSTAMKVADIRKLDESYAQKKVVCEVTVKKFDEKMNWYSPFCIQCDQDLLLVDGIYKCCKRIYPYPDKTFRLYSLSSDESGTIPIVWPDDEISRLTGKTIYDVECEDLESFEKKKYRVTILLTEENVKSGSKVYNATNISNPVEITDSHEPTDKGQEPVGNTPLSKILSKTSVQHKAQTISITKDTSPPTVASTTRTRSRMVDGTMENVKTGRTDWKIQVRVLRKWIVVTRNGVVFKGFNLLLLDSKNCRMHATVPGSISERMDHALKIVFIQKNIFDLYEYSELKKRADQVMYLTDVIGVLEKKEKANYYKNKDEVDTIDIRFKITDGRKKINVTFWGSFAEEFGNALDEVKEEIIIVIIASAKVKAWQDQIDITNYSPTQFYINCEHHSVTTMRKMFKVTVIAADDTGGLEIILNDREVRALINKMVEELESKDDVFPQILTTIQGKDYTFKIHVTKDNIEKKNQLFVATNIMLGWNFNVQPVVQEEIEQNTQSKIPEPSGSSYHLDDLSQLNCQTK